MAAVGSLLAPATAPSKFMLGQLNDNQPSQSDMSNSKVRSTNEAQAGDLTSSEAISDIPKRGDERIVVVIHEQDQQNIVAVFAEVLGRSVTYKTAFDQISNQHAANVVGMPAGDAQVSLEHRKADLMVVINTHCVDSTTSMDEKLSASCDYEFLFTSSSPLRSDLARFTSFVLGHTNHHQQLMTKPRTYFISTTFPDVRAALPNMDILTVGSDAVEIRVDLLQEPLPEGGFAEIPSLKYVGEQVMLLRQNTELPIIFTTRSTDFSNGRFPMDNAQIYQEYLSKAIQWGLEYIDVELWLPEDMRRGLFQRRGNSRVMSAFHDFSGDFRWSSPQAEEIFRRSMAYSDIIKMITIVGDQSANFELEYFRSKMLAEHPNAQPFSAVNMGEIGQLSRTLNRVFTPVTHPLLPIVAAPGQMSTAQINESLASLGHLPRKTIYGVTSSPHRGPMPQASFYEKCLNELGLPHQFMEIKRQSKGQIGELDFWCDRKDFGGAYLDPGCTYSSLMNACTVFSKIDNGNGPELSDAVKAIGIVDTIIVIASPSSGAPSAPSSMPSSPRQRHADVTLNGRHSSLPHNTRVVFDHVGWRGILRTLTRDLTPSLYLGRPAIMFASSSHDAAPTLFAMKALGISKIYTVGFRTPETLSRILPKVEPVASLESLQRARSVADDSSPVLIVSALSSQKSNLIAMVVRAFGKGQTGADTKRRKVFLDLSDSRGVEGSTLGLIAEQNGFAAYEAADVAAFTTVESLRMLVGQNVPYSFVRLTSGTPSRVNGW